jgi:hypothetical protein
MNGTISLEDFKKQLAQHDWFYYFSDDHGVWQRGERDSVRLQGIATTGNDDFKRAYNDACAIRFNTPSFVKPGATYQPPFKVG